MAPISEKRSPPGHIKDNAKENASTQINKKSLEIQDFHETWLKDIEIYKNQVRMQQMLTTHNHLHTSDGCSTESVLTLSGKRHIQQNGNSIVDYEGLNLKRPREETPKSHHGKNIPSKSNRLSTNTNAPIHSQESSNSPAKIIVNSFHASLLNSKNSDLSSRLQYNINSQTSPSVRFTYKNKIASANLPANPKPEAGIQHKLISFPPISSSLEPHDSRENSKGESPSPDDVTSSHPNVDADDNNSVDGIGDIDGLNAFEDSDDDLEEYVGTPFMLDSDDQIKNMSDAVTVIHSTPKSILTPSLFPEVAPYLTFSSYLEKGPPVPAPLHKVLKWKLSPVMPRIVRRVIFNSGFRLIKKTTDWMAVWEKHMRSPGFKTIRSHQKFNHMPGSFRIGRKDSMWKNLRSCMSKHGKSEFGFMQKTYVLPEEFDLLKKVWPKESIKATKWIVKPPASARGTGISVINKWSQIPKDKPVVVQKYIEKPLLINENKFDLRIYVLVTSVNPLRIYMYKNGLARFASVKYSSESTSLNDRCMHLTNYSINKLSENYSKNEDVNACQGHKWTLQSLWSYLEKRHVDTKRLWGTLRNLVIKSLISGEGCLNRMYRSNVNSRYNCYELFGFDVLLDENLIPWLLEINISPSLHSELPLDLHVKGPLIQGVLNTALYQVPPKLTLRQQAEILYDLNLSGPLCYNRLLFTTVLSSDEIKKHNFYTSRLIDCREEYLDTILDALTPDDVRCLIIAEDELARCNPLERIFPNADTYEFLKFVENPRYYNRLLDAWETKYADNRQEGIEVLRKLCSENYHMRVPAAALIEEPKIDLTDIDLMYMKPEEIAKRRDSNDLPIETNQRPTGDGTNIIGTQPCSSEIIDSADVLSTSRPIAVGSN